MPIVEIKLIEGRTVDQKREMAQAITQEICRIAQVPPERVIINFVDMKKENIANAGKLKSDD